MSHAVFVNTIRFYNKATHTHICLSKYAKITCHISRQLQGALNNREREINSLRRQVDASQDELAGLRRDKEITIRENRRLQDDLATMTRENQVNMSFTKLLYQRK